MTVTLAFNYGGRAEIIEATKRMIAAGVTADKVDESLFATYLDTKGLPDPDLVVRTSGEMRLSNFLLWQAAYSEYYFSPCYWPDFDEAELDRAILAYGQRRRRFGGLNGNGAKHHKNGAGHKNGSSLNGSSSA
jgi:undecaprenyl diphosphate synthase